MPTTTCVKCKRVFSFPDAPPTKEILESRQPRLVRCTHCGADNYVYPPPGKNP